MILKKVKYIILVFILILTLLLIIMFYIKMKSLYGSDSDLSLAIRYEGLYHEMNYRDLGKSINECYGEKLFNENMISRSAGWFSGWGCEKIGNPDVLYSLNYSPKRNEHFFCYNPDNKLIGRSFEQKIELNDIEFIENWNKPEIRETTCSYIDNIFDDSEKRNLLNSKMINAIECDYRKTTSLIIGKYGRMEKFLEDIIKKGSIENFMLEKCSISKHKIESVSKMFINL
jgi:predicted Holliday junction resolvase-like endonuclease